jgi:DHA1 family inner membrane transport protein
MPDPQLQRFRKSWQVLLGQKPVLAALAIGFLFSASNDNLFIVYGAWLEKAFGLSIISLGMGTAIIGMAEFSGELITAAISDRMGLRRSVIIGFCLTAAGYLSLALFNQSLWFSYVQLFLIFITFEFTIVAFLTLCTELAPGLRATMMSAFLAAAGIGRFTGTLIGIPLWNLGGIAAVGTVSAIICLACVGVMVWGVKGWRRQG